MENSEIEKPGIDLQFFKDEVFLKKVHLFKGGTTEECRKTIINFCGPEEANKFYLVSENSKIEIDKNGCAVLFNGQIRNLHDDIYSQKEEIQRCIKSPYYFATKYLTVNGKPFRTLYGELDFNKFFNVPIQHK